MDAQIHSGDCSEVPAVHVQARPALEFSSFPDRSVSLVPASFMSFFFIHPLTSRLLPPLFQGNEYG